MTLPDRLPVPHAFPHRVPRFVWHAVGLVAATLLAWLIWRGYQSPDFLLDLGALRIC